MTGIDQNVSLFRHHGRRNGKPEETSISQPLVSKPGLPIRSGGSPPVRVRKPRGVRYRARIAPVRKINLECDEIGRDVPRVHVNKIFQRGEGERL